MIAGENVKDYANMRFITSSTIAFTKQSSFFQNSVIDTLLVKELIQKGPEKFIEETSLMKEEAKKELISIIKIGLQYGGNDFLNSLTDKENEIRRNTSLTKEEKKVFVEWN